MATRQACERSNIGGPFYKGKDPDSDPRIVLAARVRKAIVGLACRSAPRAVRIWCTPRLIRWPVWLHGSCRMEKRSVEQKTASNGGPDRRGLNVGSRKRA